MTDPGATGDFTVPAPDRLSWTELASGVTNGDSKNWVRMPSGPAVTGDVWHYTDVAGAIGIMKTGTLWATAVPFLNDTSEFEHGQRVLEIVNRALQASKYIHPVQKRVVAQAVVATAEVEIRAKVYVACVSEVGDSLSQWRSYGRHNGVAMRIDIENSRPAILQDVSDDDNPVENSDIQWRRVAYGDEASYEYLLEALGFICHTSPPPTSSSEETGSFAIDTAAPILTGTIALCKNEAFRDEREVRAVVQSPDGAKPLFRAGPYGPTPYLPLAFVDAPQPLTDARRQRYATTAPTIPIRAVTVGPGPHGRTTALGIDLLTHELGIALAEGTRWSQVPYR